jgi:hypothetical protein
VAHKEAQEALRVADEQQTVQRKAFEECDALETSHRKTSEEHDALERQAWNEVIRRVRAQYEKANP